MMLTHPQALSGVECEEKQGRRQMVSCRHVHQLTNRLQPGHRGHGGQSTTLGVTGFQARSLGVTRGQ